MLHSADFPVDIVLSSEVPVTAGENTTGLAADLDNVKAGLAELESVEAMTVRRHDELSDEIEQRHAEEISV